MAATVPPITPTGEPPNERWLFNGQTFTTEANAKAARQQYIDDQEAERNRPGQS